MVPEFVRQDENDIDVLFEIGPLALHIEHTALKEPVVDLRDAVTESQHLGGHHLALGWCLGGGRVVSAHVLVT
jgi:dienelactone hydrolase